MAIHHVPFFTGENARFWHSPRHDLVVLRLRSLQPQQIHIVLFPTGENARPLANHHVPFCNEHGLIVLRLRSLQP